MVHVSTKSGLIIAGVIVVAGALYLGAQVCGIWIPDLLASPKWISVADAKLPTGENLHVFQRRISVFYSTFVISREGPHWQRAYLVAVDSPKCLSAVVDVTPDQQVAAVKMCPLNTWLENRDEEYNFDWGRKQVRSSERAEPFPEWSIEELEASYGALPGL